jgi:hypothetical protein
MVAAPIRRTRYAVNTRPSNHANVETALPGEKTRDAELGAGRDSGGRGIHDET